MKAGVQVRRAGPIGSVGTPGAAKSLGSGRVGRTISALFLGVALASTPAVASGCGGEAAGPESTSGSRFAEEYARLHGDTDVATLAVAPRAVGEIAAAVEAGCDPGVLVLLPPALPSGFALAAPFRGTGSGAALPNPHTWGDGYAVTYTDGRARLTLMVDPDEPVDGGVWEETGLELLGRALLVQDRDGLVVVSTAPEGGGPVVVAVGERVDRATVLAFAAGLRDARER